MRDPCTFNIHVLIVQMIGPIMFAYGKKKIIGNNSDSLKICPVIECILHKDAQTIFSPAVSIIGSQKFPLQFLETQLKEICFCLLSYTLKSVAVFCSRLQVGGFFNNYTSTVWRPVVPIRARVLHQRTSNRGKHSLVHKYVLTSLYMNGGVHILRCTTACIHLFVCR